MQTHDLPHRGEIIELTGNRFIRITRATQDYVWGQMRHGWVGRFNADSTRFRTVTFLRNVAAK